MFKRSAKAGKGYKCTVCGRYFKTLKGFRSHLNMVKRTGSHYPSTYKRRY